MATEEKDAKYAYVEGRLLGLSQLVAVLREAMDAEEGASSPLLLRSLVLHISSEMESILEDLKEKHGEEHPVIQKVERKMESIAKSAQTAPETQAGAKTMKKNVEAADELMKNLLALREQESSGATGEGEEEQQ